MTRTIEFSICKERLLNEAKVDKANPIRGES